MLECVARPHDAARRRRQIDGHGDDRRRADREVVRVLGQEFQQHIATERESDQQQPARRQLRIERSEEHTSELQSLMRISYAVFCLKKKPDLDDRVITPQKMYSDPISRIPPRSEVHTS